MNCSVCNDELETVEILPGVTIEMEDPICDDCFDELDPEEF